MFLPQRGPIPTSCRIAAAQNRGMQTPVPNPRCAPECAYRPHGEFRRNEYFIAQLLRQTVDHLVGFLRDRFLHLHLQHEVRAALQVQAEFDLLAEIALTCATEVGKVGSPINP